MRQIGSFPDDRVQHFVDYLVANGMPAETSRGSDGTYEVWIIEEDHLAEASRQFTEFSADPQDDKYRQAATQARKVREQLRQRAQQFQKNIVRVNQRTGLRKPPLCLAILIICIVSFALSNFRFDDTSAWVRGLAFMAVSGETLAGMVAQSPGEVEELLDSRRNADLHWIQTPTPATSLLRGEIWRALTPAFLHGSFIHIIFNMYWLVSLGFLIERREGTRLMLGLVLAAGIIPNLLQGLMPVDWDGTGIRWTSDGQALLVPFCGFSGVVYGLFGFVWLRGVQCFVPEYQLPPALVVLMIAWFLLGVIGLDQTLVGIKMANWGHGGGLAIGMLLATLPIGRSGQS